MLNQILQNLRKHSWWCDLLVLLALCLTCFSFMLGQRPLSVPDEARYSEIPREMLVSHDYITPHLNGIKYFEKPPLLYWLQAGSLRLIGFNEWGARIPNMLFAVLGCLLIYVTTRKLYDRNTAWLASLILANNLLYFALGHTVTTDMLLTLCFSATLYSFIIAANLPPGVEQRLWFYAAYSSAALAVLTKGLVAILLPGLIVVCWILLCQQWQILKRLYLISGLLLFCAISLPWHYLVQQANPEFFQFYFIDQQFSRYLTMYAQRYQPMWFFIPILLAGLFPWVVILPQTIRYYLTQTWKVRSAYKNEIFFLLWASLVFIFFSCSKSKLIPYILPAIPPLVILLSTYLTQLWRTQQLGQLQDAVKFFSYLCCLLGLASFIIPPYVTLNDPTPAKYSIGTAGVMFAATGWLVRYYFIKQQQFKRALTILLSGTFIAFCCLLIAVPAVDTRSIKPLALTLQKHLETHDEVVSFKTYYQDLPFYLQRLVTIVRWKNELTFGLQHQANAHQRMIDEAEFWRRWSTKNKVYMVIANRYYQDLLKTHHQHLHLIQQTTRDSLVSNQ